MSFRTLLLAKAAVCLAFGLPLLIAPGWLFGILGGTLGPAGTFAAREYGAAMSGTLMLTWLARDVPDRIARRAILADLLVYDAIGVVIAVAITVTAVLNALGWGIVMIYLLFTAGSAYLLMEERRRRPAPERRVAAGGGFR
jgi:hypothetical protein